MRELHRINCANFTVSTAFESGKFILLHHGSIQKNMEIKATEAKRTRAIPKVKVPAWDLMHVSLVCINYCLFAGGVYDNAIAGNNKM